jgi:GWxTD domain-containing protein
MDWPQRHRAHRGEKAEFGESPEKRSATPNRGNLRRRMRFIRCTKAWGKPLSAYSYLPGKVLDMTFSARVLVSMILAEGLAVAPLAHARNPQCQQEIQPSQTVSPSPHDGKKASKVAKVPNLLREIGRPLYWEWAQEDVAYIITPEELTALRHLSTNEEREEFIEQFWARRNPDPDSPENTFKEEHYRRIAYANEHFSTGVPGWKTDRGRIYIVWGPPDEIDSHPNGADKRPLEEGGGSIDTYPYEDWRYRRLEGVGDNVILEFVDPHMTGDYRLTVDPKDKDKPIYILKGDSTVPKEEVTTILIIRATKAPPIRFKDLEAIVTSRLVRDEVKFAYHCDFLRATSTTVLVPIRIEIPARQLTFNENDAIDTATVNLFGRISTLSGHVVETFEDTLTDQTQASMLQQALSTSQTYQTIVPLTSALYRLDIVVEDVNRKTVGTTKTQLAVPRFPDDQLSSSSMILGDYDESVSGTDAGLGPFAPGSNHVRPKIDRTFTPSDSMGVFLQVYNLKVDDQTRRADVSVELRVTKDKDTEPSLKFSIPPNKLPAHGEQMTIADKVTLASLAPGRYKLEVAVTDNLAKQTITPFTEFTVRPAQP